MAKKKGKCSLILTADGEFETDSDMFTREHILTKMVAAIGDANFFETKIINAKPNLILCR